MANTPMQRSTVHYADLPWNVQDVKQTDLIALLVVVVLAIIFAFIKLEPVPIKVIDKDFDRTVLIPPPLEEAPKEPPKPVETKKEEQKKEPDAKKTETKAEAKPEPKPTFKQKLDEAKPIPQAAKPVSQAEQVALPAPKFDQAAIQAAKVDAARQKGLSAVLDTGLGNAVAELATIDTSTVNSNNLHLGGDAGSTLGKGKVGLDKNIAGGGRSGNKSGAVGGGTGGDGTGTGGGAGVATRGTGSGGKAITDTAKPSTRAKDEPKEEKATSGKRTDFDRVMGSAEGRIGKAHKRALDDDPTLTGSFRVKVKVSGDGAVTSASIASSDLGGHDLEGKILAIVKGLSFAPGFADYEGTYSYTLTAQ